MSVTLSELALELGLPDTLLVSISSRASRYYVTVGIPKKNGSTRIINSPSYKLKAIQAWILRNILETIPCHHSVHGFLKGRGIKTNVVPHLSSKYLLCIDIKNFFPSIKKKRVSSLFESFGYEGDILEVLTNICTYKDYLPQGAVTSPYISNLIFKEADAALELLCSTKDVAYTRYADDLAFSSNDFDLLTELIPNVYRIIKKAGFQPNESKTRIYTGKGRKLLTGLVINSKKPSIGKQQKRLIRAMLHALIIKSAEIDTNKLLGLISFLLDIEPSQEEKLMRYKNRLLAKKRTAQSHP